MANIEHSDITDPEIHEPKGVASATSNQVYAANGSGSGTWKKVGVAMIESVGKLFGKIIVADGAGGTSYEAAVWKDLIGDVTPRTAGAQAPTITAFRGGNARAFAYSVNDEGDIQFHIPHDYKMGSDVFLHMHWSHNGTAISGNFITNFYVTYAKGHNQAIFPAEVTTQIIESTPSIAAVPRYQHRIKEIQLSATTPGISQIDSDDLEPDGLITIRFIVDTIPTITGGTPNEPFIFFIDLHYQADMIGTKNKAPNFFS